MIEERAPFPIDPENDAPSPEERLGLYRRAARALGNFFSRHTSRYCAHCLEITRQHHRTDPRADVELLEGIFPGCCHAGVGDTLSVPRSGEEGRFSADLADAMVQARLDLGPGRPFPLEYSIRERQTGRLARGVACIHIEPGGCRLGDLKAPLCVAYLCEPVREVFATAAGPELIGSDTDDFCGARDALRASVSGTTAEALLAIGGLEVRLEALSKRLERAGA